MASKFGICDSQKVPQVGLVGFLEKKQGVKVRHLVFNIERYKTT